MESNFYVVLERPPPSSPYHSLIEIVIQCSRIFKHFSALTDHCVLLKTNQLDSVQDGVDVFGRKSFIGKEKQWIFQISSDLRPA
jgi:hypothetical protein